MSVQQKENSTQPGRSAVRDLEKETAEKTVNPGLLRILEPGAPRIVLGILLVAALGVLFFAFSSCF